jgi:hypothetical protein
VKRRAVVCVCLLALAGVLAVPAYATPGFFTGVVEQEPALSGPAQASFADLGLGGAYVWVHWASGHPLTDADVASVTDTVDALPPGARVVVGVGGPGLRDGLPATPLDAATRDEYCGFVRDLLDRVPEVRDVVLWNEPNKTAGWAPQYDGTTAGAASLAPAAYVALLARCWDVLHAFRSDVNVIAFNTSPSGNDNAAAPSNISHSPSQFILRMGTAYRASGRQKRIFDTVAHHPYGVSPRERPWIAHGSEKQISEGDWSRLMSALTFAFAGTKQAIPGQCFGGSCVWIWYTEAGFQTTVPPVKEPFYSNGPESEDKAVPDDAGGEPLPFDPGAPGPDQRTQLADALALASCQPYVQAFFNYRLLDDADLKLWQSGLLWTDGTPKASYAYAKTAIAQAHAGTVDCDALKGGPAPAAETTAPGRPAAVKAHPGVNRVVLTWKRGGDLDVMGYVVERAPSAHGPWTRLASDPVSAPRFTDHVPNGKTRHYAVRAVDTAENVSGRSKPTCGTPTPAKAKYAPAARKLRANDARRAVLAGSGHAALRVAIRLPKCARTPRRLRLELDLSAAPAGVSFAVSARAAGTRRWSSGGHGTAGARDRAFSLALPRKVGTGRTVIVRLAASAPRPFRLRVDLLRLAVTS